MARVKVPFGERYRTSKAIFRESMAMLRKERDLWVFGILAGVSVLLMMAALIVPMMLLMPKMTVASSGSASLLRFLLPVLLLPIAYPFSIMTTLFQSALAFGLHERMARRKCTPGQAWTRALDNIGTIARFNLLAMLIGGIFALLGQVLSKLQIIPYLGQAVQTIGMYAWAVASFFVIPVIVVKQEGSALGALRDSVGLARSQWGKAVGGLVTIGLVFLVPMLIYMAVVMFLVIPGGLFLLFTTLKSNPSREVGQFVFFITMGVLILMLLPLLFIMPVQMSATTAYQTGLYRYATTGKVPKGFSEATIVDAWQPYRDAQS